MKKLLLIIFTMLVSVSCINEPEGTLLNAGDRLPVFEIELNDGTLLTSADISESGGTIVFFNTTCHDCQRELPLMQLRYDTGENIICISREEGAGPIADFWEANGLTMPWSAQSGRTLYSKFAKSGIPRVYEVAPGGVITRQYLAE